MALTPDYENLIIHSDTSITDIVAFHAALRDIEASSAGILYPAIHTYKQVPLNSGAIFPAVGFVNGWTLQFPAGTYQVNGGNLNATINPVAGCYVERTQAAAYAVTSVGGVGLSQDDLSAIAQIVADQLAASTIGGLTDEQSVHLMERVATRNDLLSIL